MNNLPIGVFDSGVGGLSVLHALSSRLPSEDIVYFADQAHFPYGEKSSEQLIRYSVEITEFLLKQNIKLLIVACHTASTHALDVLQERFSIPIIGMVQPTVQEIISTHKKRIAILGTHATIRSQIYKKHLEMHAELIELPCPELINIVEENQINAPNAASAVDEALSSLKSEHVELALLGSTHLSYLNRLIQGSLGPHVYLLDPAQRVAETAASLLCKEQLLKTSNEKGTYRFFVSKDPVAFAKFLAANPSSGLYTKFDVNLFVENA